MTQTSISTHRNAHRSYSPSILAAVQKAVTKKVESGLQLTGDSTMVSLFSRELRQETITRNCGVAVFMKQVGEGHYAIHRLDFLDQVSNLQATSSFVPPPTVASGTAWQRQQAA